MLSFLVCFIVVSYHDFLIGKQHCKWLKAQIKMNEYFNKPKMNQMSPIEMEEYFIDFVAQILVDQIINENGEENEQIPEPKNQKVTRTN